MTTFLLVMGCLWLAGLLFAWGLNLIGGDPLPPPTTRYTLSDDESRAYLVCEGVDVFTAATLVDMCQRDHDGERVVRLRYQGREYEVKRGRQAVVRALSA